MNEETFDKIRKRLARKNKEKKEDEIKSQTKKTKFS